MPNRLTEAFHLPQGGWSAEIRETLAEMERVHRCDRFWHLPRVSVRWSNDTHINGQILYPLTRTWFVSRWDEAIIEISINGKSPRGTFLHEVGHLIDSVAGAEPRPGKRQSLRWGSLHYNIVCMAWETPSIRALDNAVAQREPPEREMQRACYYLRNEEIWARIYAQYVALRCGNPSLRRGLEAARNTNHWSRYRVWQEEEFAPLADVMDALTATWR